MWLNPPYEQPLVTLFAEALVSRLESGEVEQACVLVNNATETRYGQLLLGACCAMCCIRGRVRFLDTEGNRTGASLQGQILFYMGKNETAFRTVFAGKGQVLLLL